MTLFSDLTRSTRHAACAAALAVLAACGGGDRVEPFAPTRLVSFGDETSVLDDSVTAGVGRKYSVNALKTENNVSVLDCSSNAIWIQYPAATFSFTLPECNPNAVADPKSRLYAANGAKVADLGAQIDTHLLSDTFSGEDLVTVLIGANDVLAQYALYTGSNEPALIAAVEAAGAEIAAQVNRIATIGGKVIVSTVPDMGLTPFAVAEESANAGRAGLLTRLTAALNVEMRAKLINDGRMIGLVLADEIVQTAVKFPSLYQMTNVTAAACDITKAATLNLCTSETLVTGGSATTWLWADATHLSPAGHRLVGQLAQQRAVNNPF